MSYEGYNQFICKNGHYWVVDAYECSDDNVCPTCDMLPVWQNQVDVTNGSRDEDGNRIDGYIKPVLRSKEKCEHCGSIIRVTYEIPIAGDKP